SAVGGAARCPVVLAETGDRLLETGAGPVQDRPGVGVQVDHPVSGPPPDSGDGGFARADPTGQSDAQGHARGRHGHERTSPPWVPALTRSSAPVVTADQGRSSSIMRWTSGASI